MLTFGRPETPKLVLWQTVETQNAAFHAGSALFLRQNQSSDKEIYIFLKPSIYTMDHPDSAVCSSMENSIGLIRINEGAKSFSSIY